MDSNKNEPYLKMLEFMAHLTNKVQKINPSIKPVVVGGSAVVIYTLGGHITYDIDFIVSDTGREIIKDILQEMGFKKLNDFRHWSNEKLDIILEIPDDILAGDWQRITTIELNGSEVYIIGPEDLLIDRLCAAKHWESNRDEHQSISLLEMFKNELDWEYLRMKAKEELVEDLLNELILKTQEVEFDED